MEGHILKSWCDYTLRRECFHLSKHYDGLRIDRASVRDEPTVDLPGPSGGTLSGVDAYVYNVMKHIAEDTGFTVQLREKFHWTMYELIDNYLVTEGIVDNPDYKCVAVETRQLLERHGNCQMLAMAHYKGRVSRRFMPRGCRQ